MFRDPIQVFGGRQAQLPEVYLADVLIKLQGWPQSRIDELLPDRWARQPAQAKTA